MDISSNKLLPVLGSIVVFIITGIAIKSCTKGQPEEVVTAAKTQAPADVDSPADTMRALRAEVADMRLEAERLRKNNDASAQRQNQMSTEISNQVKQDIRNETLGQRDSALESMMKKVDDLNTKYSANSPTDTGTTQIGNNGIDPDFSLTSQPDSIRVEPLNAASLLEKLGATVTGLKDKAAGVLPNADGSLLHGLGDNSVLKSHLPSSGGNSGIDPASLPEPVYTIPRNSTLVGSTGMTALIGRIPIKGNVNDPYPFKVIVGSDNLAANGLEIPGVDGMIFTGNALGDWTLSCVRGQIHSVTYVFEDGTIRTLSSDDQSLQQKSRESAQASGQNNPSQGGGRNNQQSLGWISDRRGIPCISGTRITNAPQYLGGRFLARAVGAAGEAYARSQTTVTSSPLTGGATSAVTGDSAKFALGSLASGSSDELAQWIAERQAQNYDAVFVDTGEEVAIHVDRELPIDFEPHGRKLAYARKKRGQPAHVAALD